MSKRSSEDDEDDGGSSVSFLGSSGDAAVQSLYANEDTVESETKRKKTWKERFSEGYNQFRDELENYELLSQLEEGTGIRKIDIVSVLGLLFTTSLLLGWGGRHWCELVAFTYPAYATIQCIQSKEKLSSMRWLTYWVFVSFLTLVEQSMGSFLVQVLPFYYPFKFGLVMWCQSPKHRGSMYVYSHVLAPFLKCHYATTPLQSPLVQKK